MYEKKYVGEGCYTMRGPGLSRYLPPIYTREADADAVARMLARAYEAGKEAKSKEIREVLGVLTRG